MSDYLQQQEICDEMLLGFYNAVAENTFKYIIHIIDRVIPDQWSMMKNLEDESD